jgi:hypothetical protein
MGAKCIRDGSARRKLGWHMVLGDITWSSQQVSHDTSEKENTPNMGVPVKHQPESIIRKRRTERRKINLQGPVNQ